MSKSIYLPGLNGLRAIAAIAVVISHITQSLGEFGLNPYIFGKTLEGTPKGLELAGYGVSIFFALSGFLITYLLLFEKESGGINIKNFYIRRILRIWPLYYLYLSLAVLTIFWWGFPFNSESLFFYLFFTANIPFILGIPLPFLGHYWSLGVEEQFYAFWPWVAKLKVEKLLKVAILLFFMLVIAKILLRVIDIRYNFNLPYYSIHVTRFHCMLLGAIGAILYYTKNNLFMKLTTATVTQLICWLSILVVLLNKFHIFSAIDNELISAIALCLIMGQVAGKKKIINLENNFMDFIGKISFGIYVYHPLIIFYASKFLNIFSEDFLYNYFIIFLLVTSITILVAYFSYEYFEKRFLRIKLRFSTINSISAKNV